MPKTQDSRIKPGAVVIDTNLVGQVEFLIVHVFPNGTVVSVGPGTRGPTYGGHIESLEYAREGTAEEKRIIGLPQE